MSSSLSFAAAFIVNRVEDFPDFMDDGVCFAIGLDGEGHCTLRAAVMESNNTLESDSIYVSNNLGDLVLSRIGDDDTALYGDLDISGKLTIQGPNNGFVIDANHKSRVFDILAGGELVLKNGTLINGQAVSLANYTGGAVYINKSGSLKAYNVIFANNVAGRGGAIFNDGVATIDKSYFHHNTTSVDADVPSKNGTAIYSRKGITIKRSTFSNNDHLLTNPNNLELDSFLLYAINSQPSLSGGQPILTIEDSTIVNNQNGILSTDSILYIARSTIANNEYYGLEFLRDSGEEGVQLRIRASIFSNNKYDCSGFFVIPAEFKDINENYNASSDDLCDFTGLNGFQNINHNSQFNGSLSDWGGDTPTQMIYGNVFDSANVVIDKIPSSSPLCNGADQRGVPRPTKANPASLDDPACDIGAVEFNPSFDPLKSDIIFKDAFEL